MKILCATDLLPKSDGALVMAGRLADSLGADLTLLHVVSLESSHATLEDRLRSATQQLTARARPPLWRAQCVPQVGVLPGDPARLVLAAVEESRSRLLVLGPHRRRPMRDLLGSTLTEKALEARKCPVLIVRDPPRQLYRRVLLALDATASSATAVQAAATLVLAPDTSAQVVHVYESPYAGIPEENLASLEADAVRSVRNLLGRERSYFTGLEIRVDHGDPAAAIGRSVEDYRPDLLVLGTRGLSRLRRTVSSSIANRVLDEVQRDMLIVPEGSFVAPVGDRRQRPAENEYLRTGISENAAFPGQIGVAGVENHHRTD